MPGANPRIIICIPAFNEAKNIADIVRKAKFYAGDVIVCDDGSLDNTSEMAKGAGATVIRHPENRGYGSAIRTLFQAALDNGAEVMITMDSDGQHNADQIPAVLQPVLNKEADVVIGSRFLNDNDKQKIPGYRSLGIRTITRFTQVVSYNNITDAQSGFRAYSKRALSSIHLSEEGMAVSAEILVRARENNLIIKEVPVTISYDIDDTSSQNPLSHGLGVLGTVVRFISLRHPLAFYGVPGLILLVIAGGFMTSALDLFSSTRYVSTNMVLISIGTAMIGIMLLITGIILYAMSALIRDRLRGL